MTDFSREPLPWLMSGLDARKRQVVAELATALGGAGVSPLWAAIKDMAAKVVPQYFDPEEKERLGRLAAESKSVMPQVSGPAKEQLSREMMQAVGPADIGGAAAGIFVPASKEALEKAARFIAENPSGYTAGSLWREAGIRAQPTTGGGKVWTEEISLGEGKLKQLLAEGTHYKGPLSGFIDVPRLRERFPDEDPAIDLRITAPGSTWSGEQKPSEIVGSSAPENTLNLLEHEFQHRLQDRFDWPRGANEPYMQQQVVRNPQQFGNIVQRIVDAYRESNPTYAKILEKQYEYALDGGVDNAKWVGSQVYMHSGGEIQSRMAERANMTSGQREQTLPIPTNRWYDYNETLQITRVPPKAHLIQQDYAGSAGIIKDQAGLSPTADSFAALPGALK